VETSDQHPRFWSNGQTYTMAAICLVLGVAVGYLAHSPEQAASATPAAAVAPPQAVPGGTSAGMPSAQDLKRMADKQVAPLLAELQRHPKDADLLAKIGRSYLAAQQFQSAQRYYEQSVSLKATPDTLNELSFVYYSLGHVDKAIATLNRALKIDPRNPKVLFNLGMFQWHGRSDPKAAIAAWQNFIEANPDNPKRAQVERMIAQAKQHLNIPPGTKTDKPEM
jgi:cytochrome c-type biogenesis protein CcmH/NrfG